MWFLSMQVYAWMGFPLSLFGILWLKYFIPRQVLLRVNKHASSRVPVSKCAVWDCAHSAGSTRQRQRRKGGTPPPLPVHEQTTKRKGRNTTQPVPSVTEDPSATAQWMLPPLHHLFSGVGGRVSPRLMLTEPNKVLKTVQTGAARAHHSVGHTRHKPHTRNKRGTRAPQCGTPVTNHTQRIVCLTMQNEPQVHLSWLAPTLVTPFMSWTPRQTKPTKPKM